MILPNVEVWTGFLSGSALKNLLANAVDIRYAGIYSPRGRKESDMIEETAQKNEQEQTRWGLNPSSNGPLLPLCGVFKLLLGFS